MVVIRRTSSELAGMRHLNAAANGALEPGTPQVARRSDRPHALSRANLREVCARAEEGEKRAKFERGRASPEKNSLKTDGDASHALCIVVMGAGVAGRVPPRYGGDRLSVESPTNVCPANTMFAQPPVRRERSASADGRFAQRSVSSVA